MSSAPSNTLQTIRNEKGDMEIAGKDVANECVAAIDAFVKVATGDKKLRTEYQNILFASNGLASLIAYTGNIFPKGSQFKMCESLVSTLGEYETFYKQLTMYVEAAQRDGRGARIWKKMTGVYKDEAADALIQWEILHDRLTMSNNKQIREGVVSLREEFAAFAQ